MTEQPSGIEAAARATDPTVTDEMKRIRSLFSVTMDDKEDLISYAKEIVGLRAAPRPAASGGLRGRIKEIIEDKIEVDIDFELADFKINAEPATDAILAALPGRDEEAIRADERERCRCAVQQSDYLKDAIAAIDDLGTVSAINSRSDGGK